MSANDSLTKPSLSDNERLYHKLHFSKQDIGLSRFCAETLLKHKLHHQPWAKRGNIYNRQCAFTTTLVISYMRPFTESKGWTKLPSKVLGVYDAGEKALHHHLHDLRHTLYAHSDSKHHGVKPLRFMTSPKNLHADISHTETLMISAKDATAFLVMTDKLLKEIEKRLQGLRQQLAPL